MCFPNFLVQQIHGLKIRQQLTKRLSSFPSFDLAWMNVSLAQPMFQEMEAKGPGS
jgi:hypothetical protein